MGVPEPKIVWSLNGKTITGDDRHLLLNGRTHLLITRVRTADNGDLKCSAVNTGGQDSKSIKLQVSCKFSSLQI